MTHLEILALKLSREAFDAVELAVRYDSVIVVSLRDYYTGKAIGLSVAADLLRAEAGEREGLDKEEVE